MATTYTARPRIGCMARVVLLSVVVLGLSSFSSLTVAATKTPEQLLSEAITGSLGRTVTYVVTTRITLTKDLPDVPYNAKLTIEGSCGAERCVIDGASRYKMFNGMGSDCRITLKNLKLENAVGGVIHTKCHVAIHKSTFSRNKGGTIVIMLGYNTWTIEDSLFEHNDAAPTFSAGGALFTTSSGRGRIVRTTFRGNRAASGGAIFIGTSADGNSHVFQNCIFDSNTATDLGGAIYVKSDVMNGSGPNPMRMYFMETTFEKNVVTAGKGGALFMRSPIAASFCGSTIANKQNRAVKGNDIALFQDIGRLPTNVAFCPEKPAGLSVDIDPPETSCFIKSCIYCGLPTN